MRDWTTLLTPDEVTTFATTKQDFNVSIESFIAATKVDALKVKLSSMILQASTLPLAAQQALLTSVQPLLDSASQASQPLPSTPQ